MPTKHFIAKWVKSINWEKASKDLVKDASRYDYFDTTPLAIGVSLGLRVGKRRKVWFAAYRNEAGTWKRYTLAKRFPELGYADARQEATKAVIKILNRLDPSKEKQDHKKAPTFADLATLYIEKEAKRKKKSWSEDDRRINKHLIPALGGIKAHEVRASHIQEILDEIVDRAPTEANRTFALIRRMYNWALKRAEFENFLNFNPCSKVHTPSKENQRDRVLNIDEIKRSWGAYDGLIDREEGPERLLPDDMANIFRLLWLTAQREIEVLSIRLSDIDFNTSWWTIPKHIAKNKLTHRVPLSSWAIVIINSQIEFKRSLADLAEQKHKTLKTTTAPKKRVRLEKQIPLLQRQSESEYLFPSISKEGHITDIWRPHHKVRDYFNIVDYRPHDIRRTVASHLTSEHLRIPRLVVQKILNHKEKGVTAVYDRYSYDTEKREALDAWAQLLKIILKDDGKVVALVQ